MRTALYLPAVLCLLASAASGETRQLSLQQTIQLALRNNTQIQAAARSVEIAEARRKAVRGGIGFKLNVEASLNYWDDEMLLELPMEMPTDLDPACVQSLMCVGGLFEGLGASTVRERLTTQINVTLMQPLTPLYQAIKGHRAATLGRDAAKLGLGAVRQAIVAETTKTYLGVIQAETGKEIASSAVSQVKAHVTQAKAFEKAGLASRSDVLKAELALAEAEVGVIKAEAAVELAGTGLALLVGLSAMDRIVPSRGVFTDPPPAFTKQLTTCVSEAMTHRPDLRATEKTVRIAEQTRDITRWNFVPQVVALANYTHSTGADLMAPEHSFFVGGMLKWNLWEWGATYYGLQEAKHKVHKQQLDLKGAKMRAILEVKKAYLDLQIARRTLAVGRKGVSHAEEVYRIEQEKFERSAATTTDVLDAQLALTRAKLSYSNALYGWYSARAALRRSMGSEQK